MSQLSMRWLILPATVALFAGAFLAQPGGVSSAREDDLAVLQDDPELAAMRAELEASQLLLSERIAQKELLIIQLIEGQLSLGDVTDAFLRINQDLHSCLRAVRDNFPGTTDEEKHARNVISFAVSRVPPDQKKALQARLDGEFDQLYRQGSTAP